MRTLSLDVVATRGIATRGALVESRHVVYAAAVRAGPAGDELVAAAGDPHAATYWRSCAKPFQVLPLLRDGGFDRAREHRRVLPRAVVVQARGAQPRVAEHARAARGERFVRPAGEVAFFAPEAVAPAGRARAGVGFAAV